MKNDVTQTDYVPSFEERLAYDLQRILHYASTAQNVDIPNGILEEATDALRNFWSAVRNNEQIPRQTDMVLIKSIDALSPKIYPVTTASLLISQVMEPGAPTTSKQLRDIRYRVESLIKRWIWAAVIALLLVFATTAFKIVKPEALGSNFGYLVPLLTFANPIALGFLGACVYILRTIFRGLADQTFVLREGTTYTLRAILGAVLGFMIPGLGLLSADASGKVLGFLSAAAVPFLAGYAVEPMFAALDNIVLTVRDAVSHDPTSRKGKNK